MALSTIYDPAHQLPHCASYHPFPSHSALTTMASLFFPVHHNDVCISGHLYSCVSCLERSGVEVFPKPFIHDLGKILTRCTFLNTHVSKLKVPLYWSLISHLSVYGIYGYILVCLYDELGNC